MPQKGVRPIEAIIWYSMQNDGLVQERRALAMELRVSCINP